MHDVLILFDRADRSHHYREHVSNDGLRSLCGLDFDASVRMPVGSVRCLRCSRAATLARYAPSSTLPGDPVPASALVEFLVEALEQTGDTACASRIALGELDQDALGPWLARLEPMAHTLPGRRLLALAVQVIKRRRTLRDLQTLRQSLIYGD